MRVAIFAQSAIGYVDYPEALYARSIAWGLAQRGHNVRMLEERRNPALRRTLEAVGASASRHAFDGFPGILIHSYEHRTGARLMEWLSRELSLVELALAVDGVPQELARWIANLDHRNLTRVFFSYRPEQLTDDVAAALELSRYDLLFATASPAAALPYETIRPSIAPPDFDGVARNYMPPLESSELAPAEELAGILEAAVLRSREWKA